MSRIVWLASYPKSGNTWLRTFLANFLSGSEEPAQINNLAVTGTAASRRTFDEVLTISSSDMTEREIESHRPEVYRRMALIGSGRVYLKVHDAFTHTPKGEPIFPCQASFGAVYLVRNPMDTAISFAHHLSCPVDHAIDLMGNERAALSGTGCRLHAHLRQPLLSWSRHVTSWLDQKCIPVHVMRYEDMHGSAVETFSAATSFLNLDTSAERVTRALQQCSFPILRRQEQECGFNERPSRAKTFFRSGQVGEWKQVLTKSQVRRIVNTHGPVMRRMGYNTEEFPGL